jgi:hypothetical protein
MNLQVYAKISELCILKTVVSLKLTCFPEKEKRQHFIDTLHNLRSQTHKTRLTVRLQALNNLNFSVFLKCTIRSVSVQRHIHLVLHTPKKYSHIEALSKMTLEHKVYLEILTFPPRSPSVREEMRGGNIHLENIKHYVQTQKER